MKGVTSLVGRNVSKVLALSCQPSVIQEVTDYKRPLTDLQVCPNWLFPESIIPACRRGLHSFVCPEQILKGIIIRSQAYVLRIIVLCKNIRGRGGIKDLNILCFDYSSRLLFVNFNYTQKFNKGKDFICFFLCYWYCVCGIYVIMGCLYSLS